MVHANYLHNEFTIISYKIKENDKNNPIVVISSKTGGFSLRFMSWLRKDNENGESIVNTSIEQLSDSIAQAKDDNHKNLALTDAKGKRKINRLKQEFDRNKSSPESSLMAMYYGQKMVVIKI